MRKGGVEMEEGKGETGQLKVKNGGTKMVIDTLIALCDKCGAKAVRDGKCKGIYAYKNYIEGFCEGCRSKKIVAKYPLIIQHIEHVNLQAKAIITNAIFEQLDKEQKEEKERYGKHCPRWSPREGIKKCNFCLSLEKRISDLEKRFLQLKNLGLNFFSTY